MVSTAALRVHSLSVRFGGVQVVDRVSMDVEPGSIVGLVGPNGAGKTTLMNLITGILRPQEGDVFFQGSRINHLGATSRARRGIARTYQLVHPLRRLSVVENVMVGALYGRRRCKSTAEARRISMSLLEHVGLSHRANVSATSVSSGQQKMMDLARALAMEPTALLMDEPLAALSEQNQGLVLDVVRQQSEQGVMVVIVEHVMRAVQQACDRVIVLDRGRSIADGSPTEILTSSEVVEAYLGVTEGALDDAKNTPSTSGSMR